MNRTRSINAFEQRLQIDTGANVSSHVAFSSRVLREPLHASRQCVIERLNELCKLPVGWDGYHAQPVSFENANFAASMLASACPLDAPEPQIVPGASGDLQVEWHADAADIELHIRAPYDVDAWRAVSSAPEREDHLHLTMDFKVVADWLAELSETPIVARSSAA